MRPSHRLGPSNVRGHHHAVIGIPGQRLDGIRPESFSVPFLSPMAARAAAAEQPLSFSLVSLREWSVMPSPER